MVAVAHSPGLSLIVSTKGEFNVRTQFAVALAFIAAACMASPARAQSGAATYTAKCQMCHGANGMGATPAGKSMGAIPFNSAALIKASDGDLIAATTNGKGKMPAYKSQLTAPQIAAVVVYLRTLQK
jgi:cytochrome c6